MNFSKKSNIPVPQQQLQPCRHSNKKCSRCNRPKLKTQINNQSNLQNSKQLSQRDADPKCIKCPSLKYKSRGKRESSAGHESKIPRPNSKPLKPIIHSLNSKLKLPKYFTRPCHTVELKKTLAPTALTKIPSQSFETIKSFQLETIAEELHKSSEESSKAVHPNQPDTFKSAEIEITSTADEVSNIVKDQDEATNSNCSSRAEITVRNLGNQSESSNLEDVVLFPIRSEHLNFVTKTKIKDTVVFDEDRTKKSGLKRIFQLKHRTVLRKPLIQRYLTSDLKPLKLYSSHRNFESGSEYSDSLSTIKLKASSESYPSYTQSEIVLTVVNLGTSSFLEAPVGDCPIMSRKRIDFDDITPSKFKLYDRSRSSSKHRSKPKYTCKCNPNQSGHDHNMTDHVQFQECINPDLLFQSYHLHHEQAESNESSLLSNLLSNESKTYFTASTTGRPRSSRLRRFESKFDVDNRNIIITGPQSMDVRMFLKNKKSKKKHQQEAITESENEDSLKDLESSREIVKSQGMIANGKSPSCDALQQIIRQKQESVKHDSSGSTACSSELLASLLMGNFSTRGERTKDTFTRSMKSSKFPHRGSRKLRKSDLDTEKREEDTKITSECVDEAIMKLLNLYPKCFANEAPPQPQTLTQQPPHHEDVITIGDRIYAELFGPRLDESILTAYNALESVIKEKWHPQKTLHRRSSDTSLHVDSKSKWMTSLPNLLYLNKWLKREYAKLDYDTEIVFENGPSNFTREQLSARQCVLDTLADLLEKKRKCELEEFNFARKSNSERQLNESILQALGHRESSEGKSVKASWWHETVAPKTITPDQSKHATKSPEENVSNSIWLNSLEKQQSYPNSDEELERKISTSSPSKKQSHPAQSKEAIESPDEKAAKSIWCRSPEKQQSHQALHQGFTTKKSTSRIPSLIIEPKTLKQPTESRWWSAPKQPSYLHGSKTNHLEVSKQVTEAPEDIFMRLSPKLQSRLKAQSKVSLESISQEIIPKSPTYKPKSQTFQPIPTKQPTGKPEYIAVVPRRWRSPPKQQSYPDVPKKIHSKQSKKTIERPEEIYMRRPKIENRYKKHSKQISESTSQETIGKGNEAIMVECPGDMPYPRLNFKTKRPVICTRNFGSGDFEPQKVNFTFNPMCMLSRHSFTNSLSTYSVNSRRGKICKHTVENCKICGFKETALSISIKALGSEQSMCKELYEPNSTYRMVRQLMQGKFDYVIYPKVELEVEKKLELCPSTFNSFRRELPPRLHQNVIVGHMRAYYKKGKRDESWPRVLSSRSRNLRRVTIDPNTPEPTIKRIRSNTNGRLLKLNALRMTGHSDDAEDLISEYFKRYKEESEETSTAINHYNRFLNRLSDGMKVEQVVHRTRSGGICRRVRKPCKPEKVPACTEPINCRCSRCRRKRSPSVVKFNKCPGILDTFCRRKPKQRWSNDKFSGVVCQGKNREDTSGSSVRTHKSRKSKKCVESEESFYTPRKERKPKNLACTVSEESVRVKKGKKCKQPAHSESEQSIETNCKKGKKSDAKKGKKRLGKTCSESSVQSGPKSIIKGSTAPEGVCPTLYYHGNTGGKPPGLQSYEDEPVKKAKTGARRKEVEPNLKKPKSHKKCSLFPCKKKRHSHALVEDDMYRKSSITPPSEKGRRKRSSAIEHFCPTQPPNTECRCDNAVMAEQRVLMKNISSFCRENDRKHQKYCEENFCNPNWRIRMTSGDKPVGNKFSKAFRYIDVNEEEDYEELRLSGSGFETYKKTADYYEDSDPEGCDDERWVGSKKHERKKRDVLRKNHLNAIRLKKSASSTDDGSLPNLNLKPIYSCENKSEKTAYSKITPTTTHSTHYFNTIIDDMKLTLVSSGPDGSTTTATSYVATSVHSFELTIPEKLKPESKSPHLNLGGSIHELCFSQLRGGTENESSRNQKDSKLKVFENVCTYPDIIEGKCDPTSMGEYQYNMNPRLKRSTTPVDKRLVADPEILDDRDLKLPILTVLCKEIVGHLCACPDKPVEGSNEEALLEGLSDVKFEVNTSRVESQKKPLVKSEEKRQEKLENARGSAYAKEIENEKKVTEHPGFGSIVKGEEKADDGIIRSRIMTESCGCENIFWHEPKMSSQSAILTVDFMKSSETRVNVRAKSPRKFKEVKLPRTPSPVSATEEVSIKSDEYKQKKRTVKAKAKRPKIAPKSSNLEEQIKRKQANKILPAGLSSESCGCSGSWSESSQQSENLKVGMQNPQQKRSTTPVDRRLEADPEILDKCEDKCDLYLPTSTALLKEIVGQLCACPDKPVKGSDKKDAMLEGLSEVHNSCVESKKKPLVKGKEKRQENVQNAHGRAYSTDIANQKKFNQQADIEICFPETSEEASIVKEGVAKKEQEKFRSRFMTEPCVCEDICWHEPEVSSQSAKLGVDFKKSSETRVKIRAKSPTKVKEVKLPRTPSPASAIEEESIKSDESKQKKKTVKAKGKRPKITSKSSDLEEKIKRKEANGMLPGLSSESCGCDSWSESSQQSENLKVGAQKQAGSTSTQVSNTEESVRSAKRKQKKKLVKSKSKILEKMSESSGVEEKSKRTKKARCWARSKKKSYRTSGLEDQRMVTKYSKIKTPKKPEGSLTQKSKIPVRIKKEPSTGLQLRQFSYSSLQKCSEVIRYETREECLRPLLSNEISKNLTEGIAGTGIFTSQREDYLRQELAEEIDVNYKVGVCSSDCPWEQEETNRMGEGKADSYSKNVHDASDKLLGGKDEMKRFEDKRVGSSEKEIDKGEISTGNESVSSKGLIVQNQPKKIKKDSKKCCPRSKSKTGSSKDLEHSVVKDAKREETKKKNDDDVILTEELSRCADTKEKNSGRTERTSSGDCQSSGVEKRRNQRLHKQLSPNVSSNDKVGVSNPKEKSSLTAHDSFEIDLKRQILRRELEEVILRQIRDLVPPMPGPATLANEIQACSPNSVSGNNCSKYCQGRKDVQVTGYNMDQMGKIHVEVQFLKDVSNHTNAEVQKTRVFSAAKSTSTTVNRKPSHELVGKCNCFEEFGKMKEELRDELRMELEAGIRKECPASSRNSPEVNIKTNLNNKEVAVRQTPIDKDNKIKVEVQILRDKTKILDNSTITESKFINPAMRGKKRVDSPTKCPKAYLEVVQEEPRLLEVRKSRNLDKQVTYDPDELVDHLVVKKVKEEKNSGCYTCYFKEKGEPYKKSAGDKSHRKYEAEKRSFFDEGLVVKKVHKGRMSDDEKVKMRGRKKRGHHMGQHHTRDDEISPRRQGHKKEKVIRKRLSDDEGSIKKGGNRKVNHHKSDGDTSSVERWDEKRSKHKRDDQALIQKRGDKREKYHKSDDEEESEAKKRHSKVKMYKPNDDQERVGKPRHKHYKSHDNLPDESDHKKRGEKKAKHHKVRHNSSDEDASSVERMVGKRRKHKPDDQDLLEKRGDKREKYHKSDDDEESGETKKHTKVKLHETDDDEEKVRKTRHKHHKSYDDSSDVERKVKERRKHKSDDEEVLAKRDDKKAKHHKYDDKRTERRHTEGKSKSHISDGEESVKKRNYKENRGKEKKSCYSCYQGTKNRRGGDRADRYHKSDDDTSGVETRAKERKINNSRDEELVAKNEDNTGKHHKSNDDEERIKKKRHTKLKMHKSNDDEGQCLQKDIKAKKGRKLQSQEEVVNPDSLISATPGRIQDNKECNCIIKRMARGELQCNPSPLLVQQDNRQELSSYKPSIIEHLTEACSVAPGTEICNCLSEHSHMKIHQDHLVNLECLKSEKLCSTRTVDCDCGARSKSPISPGQRHLLNPGNSPPPAPYMRERSEYEPCPTLNRQISLHEDSAGLVSHPYDPFSKNVCACNYVTSYCNLPKESLQTQIIPDPIHNYRQNPQTGQASLYYCKQGCTCATQTVQVQFSTQSGDTYEEELVNVQSLDQTPNDGDVQVQRIRDCDENCRGGRLQDITAQILHEAPTKDDVSAPSEPRKRSRIGVPKYALVRISDFHKYKTYEVMKSTSKLPKCESPSKATNDVFVVKKE